MPEVVVLDTCVLISNVLRQAILGLAQQGCFDVAWSAVIGDEWRRNAARIWGVDAEDIQAQWEALQRSFPDADRGDVAEFKAGLQRSDPKDWHVIAAARATQARDGGRRVGIVTRNIKDFNRSELRGLGLELLDPDQLLVGCRAHFPGAMPELLSRLPDYAMSPGKPRELVEAILKRERLFRFNRLCASPQ